MGVEDDLFRRVSRQKSKSWANERDISEARNSSREQRCELTGASCNHLAALLRRRITSILQRGGGRISYHRNAIVFTIERWRHQRRVIHDSSENSMERRWELRYHFFSFFFYFSFLFILYFFFFFIWSNPILFFFFIWDDRRGRFHEQQRKEWERLYTRRRQCFERFEQSNSSILISFP